MRTPTAIDDQSRQRAIRHRVVLLHDQLDTEAVFSLVLARRVAASRRRLMRMRDVVPLSAGGGADGASDAERRREGGGPPGVTAREQPIPEPEQLPPELAAADDVEEKVARMIEVNEEDDDRPGQPSGSGAARMRDVHQVGDVDRQRSGEEEDADGDQCTGESPHASADA